MGSSRRKKATDDLVSVLQGLAVLLAVWVYLTTESPQKTVVAVIVFEAIAFALLFGGALLYRNWSKRRLTNSGIDEIDRMSGETFERFLLYHFQNLGYQAELTSPGSDWGADLLLKKDGRSVAVQAKRWNQPVGVKAIQEIVAAMPYYRSDKGMVVTSGVFTEPAYTLAASNGIELWDKRRLVETLRNARSKALLRSLAQNPGRNLPSERVCPTCGSELRLRNGKYGPFLGCSAYPACKFTVDYLGP